VNEVKLAPDTTSVAHEDDLTHISCLHDEDTALCGIDLTGAEWGSNDDLLCVVCLDLDKHYDQIGTCCRIGAEHDRG
jgi:hypothetical protein